MLPIRFVAAEAGFLPLGPLIFLADIEGCNLGQISYTGNNRTTRLRNRSEHKTLESSGTLIHQIDEPELKARRGRAK